MVTDPCSLDILSDGAKCFNCLSKFERQALKVWFLAQALKALGGTDLTDVNALITQVKCLECEPTGVLDSFDVFIAQVLAENAGASVDLTIDQLRAEIKCLVCSGSFQLLRAAESYLRCAMNAKIAPPIL